MSRVLPSGSFMPPQPTPCSSCALESCSGKILSESAGDFCIVISCLCLNNLMFPPHSSKMCHPLQEAQHTCLSREMIFPWLKWMISVCLRVLRLICLLSLDRVAAVKAVFTCVYGIQCLGTSILLPSGMWPGRSRSLLQAELSSRLTNEAWKFPKKRIYVWGPYNLWMTQGFVLKSGKV